MSVFIGGCGHNWLVFPSAKHGHRTGRENLLEWFVLMFLIALSIVWYRWGWHVLGAVVNFVGIFPIFRCAGGGVLEFGLVVVDVLRGRNRSC